MGCSDDRARSMVVLVEFPNGADKNTQAAGTVRFYGLRRKRLYWEFSWIVLSWRSGPRRGFRAMTWSY